MRRIVAKLIAGTLPWVAIIGFASDSNADDATEQFLARVNGRGMTAVTVPGGNVELLHLAQIACTADAQGLHGEQVAIKIREVEPMIAYLRKDPMLRITDPAIFLQNAAFNYFCPD